MKKKNSALSATFAAAALGVAALVTVAGGANAATNTPTTNPVVQQDQTIANEPVGTETADATEQAGTESLDATETGTEINDGADVGPDANPNEPGHQDADDATEAGAENESADDANEVESGVEGNDDAAGTALGN